MSQDISRLPRRVAEKIEVSDAGCWLWTARRTPAGYGMVWVEDREIGAHRHVYSLFHALDDSLTLDHLCRVRHCVNPDHLEQVTVRENVLRGLGLAAINARRTHCQRGHEFSDENTYVTPAGKRRCRACANMRARRQRRLLVDPTTEEER